MSYINLELQAYEEAQRAYYTADITQAGKHEILLWDKGVASKYFMNILCSSDTAIKVYTKIHAQATYIELENDGAKTVTEQNPNYPELFNAVYDFAIPQDWKTAAVLIEVINLGSVGKVKIELQTNII